MRPEEVRPSAVRRAFERWVDPAAVIRWLRDDEGDLVWLDSGPRAQTGRSVIGWGGVRAVSGTIRGSVLEFLRADLAEHALAPADENFALGWVGWIGYETRFETMRTPRTRTSAYPDAALLRLDRALVFDHAAGSVTIIARVDESGWLQEMADRLETLGDDASPLSRPSPRPTSVRWRDSDPEYLAKIDACRRAIHAGDAYLLCLTTAVDVEVDADPLQTYLTLREASPTHHGALVRIGGVALLSSSPERFLSVDAEGVVESHPIKGTRPRGTTPRDDARLADELASSEKERAENLMIVDLMRNDIAQVSRIGSVEVPTLLEVETYAPVHQLVSSVRGRLADGRTGMDAVYACFPAGSMTGAPKSSATRILDGLERAPRGIYSGAFGYFGFDGRIDLAMVIRSIVMTPGKATIGSGGGITALSVPEEELAEVKLKAATLLAVLGVQQEP